jgi:hypothetical protein
MTSIANFPISAFKNAMSTEPVTTSLATFLNSSKFKARIIMIRQEPDKTKKDALKKALPAATISGTFSRRAIAGIEKYNGLVCLDFDGKDNPGKTPAELKEQLQQWDEVAYVATSVGGAGVFAIIPTNNDDPCQHSKVVEILGSILASNGLQFDKSCKDISRMRFVSWDPEAWWNPSPAIFDARHLLQRLTEKEARRPRPLIIRDTPPPDGDRTRQRVEEYISAIEGSCVDVTSNYDDWLRLGFALANEFGMDGEGYFIRISQFHPKFNEMEARKKFSNLRLQGRRVKIGSFFKICQNNGINL